MSNRPEVDALMQRSKEIADYIEENEGEGRGFILVLLEPIGAKTMTDVRSDIKPEVAQRILRGILKQFDVQEPN